MAGDPVLSHNSHLESKVMDHCDQLFHSLRTEVLELRASAKAQSSEIEHLFALLSTTRASPTLQASDISVAEDPPASTERGRVQAMQNQVSRDKVLQNQTDLDAVLEPKLKTLELELQRYVDGHVASLEIELLSVRQRSTNMHGGLQISPIPAAVTPRPQNQNAKSLRPGSYFGGSQAFPLESSSQGVQQLSERISRLEEVLRGDALDWIDSVDVGKVSRELTPLSGC